ncbi:hypothetical protein V6N11_051875 [Hibiscus sabdariffa]|uniref:Uncharacterized protein n=1 Tax=Hibiscus sabdariffa TaxID=183260 RepID=A0ABR2U8F2_9ROSI
MLDGINGAANRVNEGDLLDGGVNVDDDVDLGTRYCYKVAGLWGYCWLIVCDGGSDEDDGRLQMNIGDGGCAVGFVFCGLRETGLGGPNEELEAPGR